MPIKHFADATCANMTGRSGHERRERGIGEYDPTSTVARKGDQREMQSRIELSVPPPSLHADHRRKLNSETLRDNMDLCFAPLLSGPPTWVCASVGATTKVGTTKVGTTNVG